MVTGGQLSLPLIGAVSAETLPWIALGACGLIILKSVLSVTLHWFATRRFATYELEIGDRMFKAYINSSWEERSKRSVAEITRIADGGIANTMAGFLLPLMRVPSMIFTFVLIIVVLLVADPLTAVIAFVYLAIVAFIVHQVVTKRSLEAAQVNLTYSYRVAILMTEMMEALKELSLRNRLSEVSDLVTANRSRSVRARANGSFLGIIPGFAFEAALIGGVILIGAFAFAQGGVAGALSSVALFAATGFRLIPAITGIQGGIVQAIASTPPAIDVIGDLTSAEKDMTDSQPPADTAVLADSPRELRLTDVRFRYPNAEDDVIRGMSLDIPLGSSLGIVGPSGGRQVDAHRSAARAQPDVAGRDHDRRRTVELGADAVARASRIRAAARRALRRHHRSERRAHLER